MTRLFVASLAALFAVSAFASEDPPSAGAYDDVSYGDIPRASFGVELVRPDGVSVVGSQYDDTRYAPAAEPAGASKKDDRVAQQAVCTCHA